MASIKTTLELANQQFMTALKESEAAVKNFQTNVASAGKGFEEGFGKLNLAAIGLAAGLIATGREVMQFADEVTDLATAHNTTATSVLALGAAMQANGGHADRVGRLMLEMSKKITEANDGNLKSATMFESLGVSMQDLGTLSETEIRNKLIKGLADIEDPATRAAQAFKIFGKAASGMDFAGLATSIEENNRKYASHEAALRSAGNAYDNLAKIATDTKIAFAEAFKPFFDIIAKLNPSIDALTTNFKLMGAAVAVLGSAAVVGGIVRLTGAVIALGVAAQRNPLVAIASLLLTAGIGIASYIGLTQESTAATDENTKAAEENLKVNRDQSNLVNAKQKELESLTKITEAFNRQNDAIQRKLKLDFDSLTQNEEQKKTAQQISEIEVSRERALLDLKNQFNLLDADGRGRQKKSYEEQQRLIRENADIEISAARELISVTEARRRTLDDLTSGLKIRGKAEEEIFKLQSQMNPLGEREAIKVNDEINATLQKRQVLLDWIIANKGNASLYEMGQGLLQGTADAKEFTGQIQEAINKLREVNGASAEPVDMTAVQDQIDAIDQSAKAVRKQKDANFEAQRTFSYGWTKSFKDYADNANNSAKIAETMFTKATQGMEDAIVGFAKTGKFEFKNLMQTIVEELLRSQIRGLIANTFGGGAGGGGNLFSGLGKLLGFASGGVVAGNQPIMVGERGPEMFIPPGNGNIIPNNQLSGGTVVNYNISAVDAMSFKALVAKDPQFLFAVTEMGRRNLPAGA